MTKRLVPHHGTNHVDIETLIGDVWAVTKCYQGKGDTMEVMLNGKKTLVMEIVDLDVKDRRVYVKTWTGSETFCIPFDDVVLENLADLTAAEYGEAHDLKSDQLRDEWLGEFEGYKVRDILSEGFTFNSHRLDVYNRYCKSLVRSNG